MAEIRLTARLAAPADDVWNLIGGFNALPDWQPATAASTLSADGRVRRVTMAAGGTVVQELLEEGEHFHTYAMSESPFPVTAYSAILRVRPDAGGEACILEWTSRFEPAGVSEDEAVTAIETVHRKGIANLVRIFGE